MMIYVDPACNILYSSYYLYGFKRRYKCRIKFVSRYFEHIQHNNQFTALVVERNGKSKNVIIDFNTRSSIDDSALAWCDVYAKVNLDLKDQFTKKILAIGPLMAIKVFSFPQTIWYAASNLARSLNRVSNVKQFLSHYRAQLLRPEYSDYSPMPSKKNYVFFISSLWKKEAWANDLRSNFITSCKKNELVDFEGGFAPRSTNDIQGYEFNTLPSRIGMKEYMQKTKRSALVFNTPSNDFCNGWRFAEYLSLGKAILSSPLRRVMPGDFRDGRHVIFTDGTEEDITTKVNQLILNDKLKSDLEKNAFDYFRQYLAPEAVVERILTAAGF